MVAEGSLGSEVLPLVAVLLSTFLWLADFFTVWDIWVELWITVTGIESSLAARTGSTWEISVADAFWVLIVDDLESSVSVGRPVGEFWAWEITWLDATFNSSSFTVNGLKLALASHAGATLWSWSWGLVEPLVDLVLYSIDEALVAVWLWSAFALLGPDITASVSGSYWYTGLAWSGVANWGIAKWWAEWCMALAFVLVATWIAWEWSLDESLHGLGGIAVERWWRAVLASFVASIWLARVDFTTAVVVLSAEHLVGLASWLSVTWFWDIVHTTLVILLDTSVDPAVVDEWFTLWGHFFAENISTGTLTTACCAGV